MATKKIATEYLRGTLDDVWTKKLLPGLRERLFNEEAITRNKRFARSAFEFSKNFFKLSQIAFFRQRLPEMDPERTNMSWIPINQDIEGAGGMALSQAVLDRLIDKARHRVIVDFCGCRLAMGCKDYPVHIGCLMMGESALEIPERSRRVASAQEAKAHVRKALEAGLIPITGKARIDNDLFMIPDKGKLLTVCFCCECCCITRFSRYMPQDLLDKVVHLVEGLSVSVTEECIGCGVCVSKCYTNAIEVRDGKARISGMCRVCGRCALHCPQHAIKVVLRNPRAVDDVVERISFVVEF